MNLKVALTREIQVAFFEQTLYTLKPDFEFNGKKYELKVITSAQTGQLLILLDRAKKQSLNIVIDMRKTKIIEKRAVEICQKFNDKHKECKILLIVSAKKVVDMDERDVII